jgi:signal transduction histidine kinase
MEERSLKYFTLRYLILAILGIIAIWAASFYWLIIEEVYDNIDDGLKDSKMRILEEAKTNPQILKTTQYEVAQFKFTPLPRGTYSNETHIYNSEIFIPYEAEEEPVRILQYIFSQEGQNYQLEIYTSTVEEDELLEDLLMALLVLYVALVASILIINRLVLQKAWSPFYRILETLKGYKIESKKEFKTTASGIIEFNRLENELLKMIKRNQDAYDQQKQFIGNASHELQTPLAIVGNKLELLMEDKDGTEEQALKVVEIHKILNRLKKLNKSLLMLSKIENQQFSNLKTISFKDIIKSALEEFEDLIDFKEINVSIEDKGEFEFQINPELAVILINNLLTNALFHNQKDGWVKLVIEPNKILVKNSGDHPLDPKLIFERFYKDEQNEHSTGLGLAMVKSIVGLYQGLSITYRYEDEHVFELSKS